MDQPKRPKDKENKNNLLRNAGHLTSLAFEMGATIYLGNLLGAWLDEYFNFTFLENTVTLVAIFLSMYLVIRKASKINS